ncbi:50S ribosomal protein L18 [bacterium]|nr:50S ribosomal protein L18 [bacterium]
MKKTSKQKRLRRKMHIRKTMSGTKLIPRVFVFKSNKYFYPGLANDDENKVIMSMICKKSEKEIVSLAKKMSKKLSKYDKLVFDRSGYKYHGLVKLFVETLRENKVNI